MFGHSASPITTVLPGSDESRNRVRWTYPAQHSPVHHQAFAAALAQILKAVEARRWVVVAGEPGAGKTTLLQAVYQVLEAKGTAVGFAQGLGAAAASNAVLLIDDADRVDSVDEWSFGRRPASTVLAGAYPLLDMLHRQRRKAVIVQLPLIGVDETPDFLSALLQYDEDRSRPVSAAAIAALARLGGGRPGVLAEMLRLAAFLTRLEGGVMIQVQHVTQAASLVADGPLPDEVVPAAPPAPVPSRRRGTLPFAYAVGLAAIAIPAGLAPDYEATPKSPPLAPMPVLAPAEPVPAEPLPAEPSPAIAPTPAPPALPGIGQIVLTVLAAPDAQAQARGTAIVSMLRNSGYAVADLQTAATRVAALELRYFSPAEADAARYLSLQLGARPIAVVANPATPVLPGAVEIVVPSTPALGRPRGASWLSNTREARP